MELNVLHMSPQGLYLPRDPDGPTCPVQRGVVFSAAALLSFRRTFLEMCQNGTVRAGALGFTSC